MSSGKSSIGPDRQSQAIDHAEAEAVEQRGWNSPIKEASACPEPSTYVTRPVQNFVTGSQSPALQDLDSQDNWDADCQLHNKPPLAQHSSRPAAQPANHCTRLVSARGASSASAPSALSSSLGVTYAELRRICVHAGSVRAQQTYRVLADSNGVRKTEARTRYSLSPGERVISRLNKHAQLAVESTVKLYSDQVAPHMLLRYHQYVSTDRQQRFLKLVASSVDGEQENGGRRRGWDVMEECRHCSPWRYVSMGGLMRSGGLQETLIGPGSDQDYMWEIQGVQLYGASETVSQQEGMFSLQVQPLQNPKFCQLMCTKQTECGHTKPCRFSAAHVRKLNKQLWLTKWGEKIKEKATGPAANLQGTVQLHETDVDFVPCIRWRRWPWPQFGQRHRPSGWPSEKVVEDIMQYGVHVVPTGDEPHQWRISTSRAEILLVRCLPTSVRVCLQMMKQMKDHLSPPLSKQINSYIFKQTAFWLCEEEGELARLEPLTIMGRILARALEFVTVGKLQHFCIYGVNDFGTFSTEKLQTLRSAICRVRENMWTLLVAAPCQHIVPIVTSHPAAKLSEHDVRLCAARNLAVNALIRLLDSHVFDPETRSTDTFEHLNKQLATDKRRGHLRVCGSALQARNMVELCLTEAIKLCPEDRALGRTGKSVHHSGKVGSYAEDQLHEGTCHVLALLQESDLQLVFKVDNGLADLSGFLTRQRRVKDDRRHPGLSQDLCRGLTKMTPAQRCRFLLNGPLVYSILVGGPECASSNFWKRCNSEKLKDLEMINANLIRDKPEDPFQLYPAAPEPQETPELAARDKAIRRARRFTVQAIKNNLSNLVYNPDTDTVKRYSALYSRQVGHFPVNRQRSITETNVLSGELCAELWAAIRAAPETEGLTDSDGDGPPTAAQLGVLLSWLTRQDLADVLQLRDGLRRLDGVLLSYLVRAPCGQRRRTAAAAAHLSSSLLKPVMQMSGEERRLLLLVEPPPIYKTLLVNFPSTPDEKSYWYEQNEKKLCALRELRTHAARCDHIQQPKRRSGCINQVAECSRLSKQEKRQVEKAKSKRKRDVRRGVIDHDVNENDVPHKTNSQNSRRKTAHVERITNEPPTLEASPDNVPMPTNICHEFRLQISILLIAVTAVALCFLVGRDDSYQYKLGDT